MKFVFTILIFTAGFFSKAQTFTIDSEKAVARFNYLKEETTGTVKGITGTITFDSTALSSAIFEGTADVKTVTTGNDQRDEHLMQEEYFHAAKYPVMTFKSTSVIQTEDGFKMTGTLTIKGVEKSVDFKFTFNGTSFEGKTSIYANDFGLTRAKNRDDSKISVKVFIPVI
ncbi:MAG: YceI family protein [Crocinitomicaceae bacterium]|nr:YceI family protein [Crocinitomicaceae bacterium]